MPARRRLPGLLSSSAPPVLFAVLFAATAPRLGAAERTLETLDEAAPDDVAAALKSTLHAKGVRVLEDKRPLVDVWLRAKVEAPETARGGTGVTFGAQMAPGTFLGVLRFHADHKDIRGHKLPAGVYTMRYALQPSDGDHLGVSRTRDFVVISPVKKDTELAPIKHSQLVKLGAETSGASHPSTLYLTSTARRERPAALPALFHDDGPEFDVLDFEIALEKHADKTLRLGLVVVGVIEEI